MAGWDYWLSRKNKHKTPKSPKGRQFWLCENSAASISQFRVSGWAQRPPPQLKPLTPLAAYKHGAGSMSCSVVTFPIPQEVVPEYSCALLRPNCSPQIRKDSGTTSFYITHLGIQDTELGPSTQYSLQADSLQGKPKNTGVGSLSLLQRIFLTHCIYLKCIIW